VAVCKFDDGGVAVPLAICAHARFLQDRREVPTGSLENAVRIQLARAFFIDPAKQELDNLVEWVLRLRNSSALAFTGLSV
jgi:hypothetical protein